MAVLLFVDLLGARNCWRSGGTEKATRAFQHFTRMAIGAMKAERQGMVLRGGIENDSAAFVCDSALGALQVAKRLFRRAFEHSRTDTWDRLWLRGSLVVCDATDTLREESRMAHPYDEIGIYTYSAPALEAISIEKSGFRGMRLLVQADAIDRTVRDGLRISFGRHSFIPLRRLSHSWYPKLVAGELMDYLWMACPENDETRMLSLKMTSRLRQAALDPEEFAQAAATQVVFHECSAIRQSVASRSRRAQARGAAN